MAQRTYTIPNAQVSRVLDGVVYQNGYQDTINGQPNPQTKAQFFDQVTYRFWKDCVRAYEATQAAEDARKASLDKVEAEIVLS